MTTSPPSVFSPKVFGAFLPGKLDVLYALELCVSEDTRSGPVPRMSVPFARPSGTSLYEADALTWRLYHCHAACIANAINNDGYGPELACQLHDALWPALPRAPVSVDQIRSALASIRDALHAIETDRSWYV